jgi:hypothetical protein
MDAPRYAIISRLQNVHVEQSIENSVTVAIMPRGIKFPFLQTVSGYAAALGFYTSGRAGIRDLD